MKPFDMKLDIDWAMADQIITQWLAWHIDATEEDLAKPPLQPEDLLEGEQDLFALRRVYWYVTGKDYDGGQA
jgi:hypothetical protein